MLNVLNMLKTCLKIVGNLNNTFSRHKSKHFTASSNSFLDKLIRWRSRIRPASKLNFTDLKQGFFDLMFFPPLNIYFYTPGADNFRPRFYFFIFNVYKMFKIYLLFVDELVLPKCYNIDSEMEKRKEKSWTRNKK